MKFIYITCNISMLEMVTDLIDEIEIANYQVVEQVTAKSHYDEPRLNTAVWPGYNASILIQEEDTQKTNALFGEITQMNNKAYNSGEFIAAHQWSIDNWTNLKNID